MPIERPAASEYDPYYEAYISKVDDEVLDQLEAQIGATRAALSGLSDEDGLRRYEPGKWSIKEVLGHLIDGERVFAYRAMCIARGERAPLPGMEQGDYVAGGEFDRRALADLLDELEHLRRSTLALFGGLEDAAWKRTGVANGVAVSVRALAFIIAGHHAHHLRVLRERYLG